MNKVIFVTQGFQKVSASFPYYTLHNSSPTLSRSYHLDDHGTLAIYSKELDSQNLASIIVQVQKLQLLIERMVGPQVLGLNMS